MVKKVQMGKLGLPQSIGENIEKIKSQLIKESTSIEHILSKLAPQLPFKEIPKSGKDFEAGYFDGGSVFTHGRLRINIALIHINGLEVDNDKVEPIFDCSGDEGYLLCQPMGMDFTVSGVNMTDSEIFEKIIGLLRTIQERELVWYYLQTHPEALGIIDGSFWGWRFECDKMKNIPIEGLIWNGKALKDFGFLKGGDLVEHLRVLTEKLIDSGRTIGINKRYEHESLAGYFLLKDKTFSCPILNDKLILQQIQPEGSYIDLGSLFSSPDKYWYYCRLAKEVSKSIEGNKSSLEDVLKEALKKVEATFDASSHKTISKNFHQAYILKTSRIFIKTKYPALPYCVEIPSKFKWKVEDLIYWLGKNASVKGHPENFNDIDKIVKTKKADLEGLIEYLRIEAEKHNGRLLQNSLRLNNPQAESD